MQNVCVRARDWLRQKWPLVKKSTLEEQARRLHADRRHQDERHAKQRTEDNKKAAEFVAAMTRLRPLRRDFGYMLNIALDARMMEFAAQDARTWEYVAEQVKYHVQRELRTMNFSQFASRAYRHEYERETLRPRFED